MVLSDTGDMNNTGHQRVTPTLVTGNLLYWMLLMAPHCWSNVPSSNQLTSA